MTEFEKYLKLEIEQVEKDQKLEDTEYRQGKKYAYYTALNAFKKLSIHGVINWVAVDEQKPPTIDLLYLTYNGDEMVFRYWNSTYFEGEHIASEPKVTHWAIVKPPCL